MTKCIVLEDQSAKQTSERPKKTIRFLKALGDDSIVETVAAGPSCWDNIELIRLSPSGLDIMFAYDNGLRKNGILYLGHWNDGVVE